MRRKSLGVVFVALALCAASNAQKPYVPFKIMTRATIKRKGAFATVKAASAGPLFQAVQAVAQEYGWVVDYEDPQYAGTDLAIHPSPKPGVPPYLVVVGGPFQCTYPVTPSLWTSRSAEQGVLQKIVSDYNKSGDSGQFKVISVPDGNFDVVGVATRDDAGKLVLVKPLLDTLVSIPAKPRTLDGTLEAVANALPVRVRIMLGPLFSMGAPNSPPSLVVGGSDVPARDLLMEAADRSGGRLAVGWTLGYQPPGETTTPGPEYVLQLRVAQRVQHGTFGQGALVPIVKGRR